MCWALRLTMQCKGEAEQDGTSVLGAEGAASACTKADSAVQDSPPLIGLTVRRAGYGRRRQRRPTHGPQARRPTSWAVPCWALRRWRPCAGARLLPYGPNLAWGCVGVGSETAESK